MNRIIDFHVHQGAWGGVRSESDRPEGTLERLSRFGVEGALVMPFAGLFSNWFDHPADNDVVYDYCREFPDRLFAAFTVNPLMGGAALDEIRRCRELHDSRVLKLHPWLQGFSVTSAEMDAVAGLCEKLEVAIIFHDGTPPYSTPLQIARLCRDFPNLKVVSGHAGLCDLWQEAIAAARRYRSFYVCICGPHLSAAQALADSVPSGQLCFGSDLSTSDLDDSLLWYRWRGFRALRMTSEQRETAERITPYEIMGNPRPKEVDRETP
ncbi:MAG: amidohydrolase [Acidobacteria bacterium]|jgi:hypothetical protein|nr:amidohydrolase [Acidobacteriota bacterium]